MPKKYHVSVMQASPRFEPVSRDSSFEIGMCLGCHRCIKRTSCVYDVYKKRKFDGKQIVDTADVLCVRCMRCVQECKNNILSKARNPQYDHLGDDYWKPALIITLWKQAENGKIPVSGAGYRGPFMGPGFDRIWTDMSEIVRPTRDGIHGREYISTLIELGSRPARLHFDDKGELITELPRILELPIPVLFDIPPFGFIGESTRQAVAEAAESLETLTMATAKEAAGALSKYRQNLIVRFDPSKDDISALEGVPMVELDWSEEVMDVVAKVKSKNPLAIVSIRVKLDENAAQRAEKLHAAGAEVIHLEADYRGKGFGGKAGVFVTELTREVHLRLVERAVRDQVTLLVTGGIAMAEHVAKIIICGADGVGIDLPALVAMECRLCADCRQMAECPVNLDKVPVTWGAQRIINLMGSWHSQLIEVLGAMGLREVRRLRGEVGRAMFFEDLERECFAPIFGERINP